MKNNLGTRMKAYEKAQTTILSPILPMIVRIDGKAFHNFTKKIKAEKPFDQKLRNCMNHAALWVLNNSQGAKLAYVQSDEITIVFTEDNFESQKWFGGVQRKIESVSASLATVGFNQMRQNSWVSHWGIFDSRAFTLPFHEVLNNLHWRIIDAERNSIQMVARTYFSHKQCNNKNTNQLQDMLFEEKGINWNDAEPQFKRGNVILKDEVVWNIPRVAANREWWESLIFADCVYYDV